MYNEAYNYTTLAAGTLVYNFRIYNHAYHYTTLTIYN